MIKTRPRRLYYFQPADSYYYIVGGKKKKVKTENKITQKQLAKINITNIIGVPKAKRVQRRKKRKTLKIAKSISDDLLKPATQQGISFYIPKKEIPELAKVQSSGTKNEELAKIVGDLVKGEIAKIPKPISAPPKKEKPVKETPAKPVKETIVEPTPVKATPIKATPGKIPEGSPSKVIDSERAVELINEYYTTNGKVPQLKTFNNKILASLSYEPIPESRYTYYKQLFNDKYRPISVPAPSLEGEGNGDDDGLYNDELEKLLYYKTHKVVPVIASDELHSLLKYVDPKQKYFTAVINTNPSTSDGSGTDGYPNGHWRCIFIDNRDDFPSAEFFDPLADKPEPAILKIMKQICEIMNPEQMFLYKQNMVKLQSDESSNCGHFVLKFIDDRVNGVPWSKATGFDKVIDKSKDGEKMIEKYKSYL